LIPGGATLAGVPARLAIFAFVALGLAACASVRPDDTHYVGVFTGEFVDGLPLYRLPTIEVVASRRNIED
jgi:hypothetical protein